MNRLQWLGFAREAFEMENGKKAPIGVFDSGVGEERQNVFAAV